MTRCQMRRLFSWLLLLGSLILFLFLGLGIVPAQPAHATVSQVKESAQQIVYRAQHSLPDSAGNTWQVLLFKRVKASKVDSLFLRLVGFPGVTEFAHPQALQIQAGQQTWSAPDFFATQAPAANVGQYDLGGLALPTQGTLSLSLPLSGQSEVSLKISPTVLQEWRVVMDTNP